MTPLVSVVLCVYNRAAYVAEAIGSILGQTFTNFELIVVDDASTDGSSDVIRSHNDPRLRCVRNERNLGHAGSLQRGFALARGDYVAIMDSDDISLPERLARQVAFLEANPGIALCGSWVETFGVRVEIRRFPTEPAALAARLLVECPLSTPTVMLRRTSAILDKLDPESFGLAFDYGYWVSIADCAPIANLPVILLKYRLHKGQITITHRAALLEGTRHILRRQLAALLDVVDEADVEALLYVFVNEATGNPPTVRIGELFERLRRANQRRRRYNPAVLDALLAEKWAHIVTAHEPSARVMWQQAVWHPGLWSRTLGYNAMRRTLRPFKPRFWKRRPA
ncbi:MAG: glycosyltransferase family 2 protein [Acidobacteriota bacterium]